MKLVLFVVLVFSGHESEQTGSSKDGKPGMCSPCGCKEESDMTERLN